MRAIIYDDHGELSLSEVADIYPSTHQVKVRAAVSGINRADLLQKRGLYPPPKGASELLGLEVSGIVEEVGEAVTGLQKGDHVMGLLSGGGYAEFVVADQGLFMKVPEALSLEEAGAIPEVFLTAYQALFLLGGLRATETVLIHAGASGVGTAAIQLAKAVGSQVIITVGNEEKGNFCQSLGADQFINYTNYSFDEIIGNNQIDLVVDVVGGDYFPKNINVLAADGRYIVLAFMGGAKTNLHLGKLLSKRIQLIGSTLRSRDLSYRARLISNFTEKCLPSFQTGELKPVIDRVYPVNDVEVAHRFMEDNLNKGKLLLSWS